MKTSYKTESARNLEEGPLLEWRYSVGPPRRSWKWYAGVIAVGLGIAGLLAVAVPEDGAWMFSMLLWTCVVLAYSLAPSRDYLGQLDGNVLYVWDIKRNRAVVERNLNEFATWKVDTIRADQLNAEARQLLLRRRDGKGMVEIHLSGDDDLDERILDRVASSVAAAPHTAPTWLERFDRVVQQLFGWR